MEFRHGRVTAKHLHKRPGDLRVESRCTGIDCNRVSEAVHIYSHGLKNIIFESETVIL